MSAPFALGSHDPASHVIVHLSDPHLLADGGRLGERYDVAHNLARTLEAIRALRGRSGLPRDLGGGQPR